MDNGTLTDYIVSADQVPTTNQLIQRMKLCYSADGVETHVGADVNGLDVDVVRLPALPAGTNNIGDVDIASALPAGTNNIGDVDIASVPTLTKGTQGSTGFSVQRLQDAGRVTVQWTISAFVSAAATETLLTVTESRDGAATTTFTSKTITSGKRLRLESISFALSAGGSAPAISRGTVRIRVNSAGATTTSSPLQFIGAAGIAGTTKAMSDLFIQEFPESMEFVGDGTRTIGVTFETIDWVVTTNTPQLWSLTICGYEY